MKNIFIILTLSVVTIAIACSQDQIRQDSSLIEKIAMDDVYHAYQTAFLKQSYHVATGTYDLQAIGIMLKKLERQGKDLCAMDDNPLSEIKGGEAYKDNICTILAASEELAERYPGIWQMSDEQLEALRERYYEVPEHQQARETILNDINLMHHED